MKSDRQLIEKARKLREEAARLLHEDGLLRMINGHGPTRMNGSFVLDLMTWPDLDVDIELPHERDIAAFFELGRDIATNFQATEMTFSNLFIHPDVPFDRGLYWGIRLLYGGQTWKLDLRGVGAADYRDRLKQFEELRCTLADSDRLAILRIKDAVCQRSNYRAFVTSMHIYEAVSRHGVEAVEEFDRWFADHKRQ